MTISYKNKIGKIKLFLVLILFISNINLSAATPVNSGIPSVHDSILVKVLFTRVVGKTRLYSNNSIETLFFTAMGDEKKLYQLFLFDMDGKLVSQTQIRNSETASISRFEKGNYIFEVFNNDDRIEYGSIVVK